ncbi:TrbG/VirB9 family P-type conjugative transfer protein [Comamonas sp. w2-DMI]|uniref:TrbG/VirB9 family P-type conjugative transfer protein n=1 Tax=Comamonas sp. w2-DMI TaxID=3126391 RepID=UPI0032E528E0
MIKYLLAPLALIATFASAQSIDGYNFKYSAEGQRSLLPTQVFDDGKQAIFQFKPGQRIPAIFYEEDGEWKLITPKEEGAYFYVSKLSTVYKLKIGYSEATIKYTGTDRKYTPRIGSENMLSKRSYAPSAKGDDFVWMSTTDVGESSVVFAKGTAKVTPNSAKSFIALARKLAEAKSIEVVGYGGLDDEIEQDLGRRRVDAIVNSLTSFGIDRSKIKTSTNVRGASLAQGGEVGARIEYALAKAIKPDSALVRNDQKVRETDFSKTIQQEPPSQLNTVGKQLYRIEVSDRTILDVLKRWGKTSGWRVIDVNFPYIPLEESVAKEITYGTFLEAVKKMEQGLHSKGYTDVKGRAFTDNVIQIGVIDRAK